MLALLVYMLRTYAEGVQRTLETHASRIAAIELWRAASEGAKR